MLLVFIWIALAIQMNTNNVCFIKENQEIKKYCVCIIKYAPHDVLFWSSFKVYPYKEAILLQVFLVILKNLSAQCSN